MIRENLQYESETLKHAPYKTLNVKKAHELFQKSDE